MPFPWRCPPNTFARVDGDEADVWFEYGPVGASFPEMADAGTAGVGGFSAEIGGLDPGTSDEFRAVASTADEGAVETFETDSRIASAGLAVALTVLYVVGLLVGVLGHASLRTRELLD